MTAPLQIDVAILGWTDSLLLMVLALVVFGPRRLPQIGRQIGKLMYEFRKASNDFKFQMEEELRSAEEADRRKKQEEERVKAQAARAAETPALPTTPNREEAVNVAAAETDGDDRGPRIQPPSTGEPVQAARPGAPMTKPEIFTANAAANASSNGRGAAHEEGNEDGGSLTEHGRAEHGGAEHGGTGHGGAGHGGAGQAGEDTDAVTEQAAQHD